MPASPEDFDSTPDREYDLPLRGLLQTKQPVITSRGIRMCGISGKLYFDPARSVEREVLERMNAVLAHRGPDDAGIYCDGPIGLAHRRSASST